MGPHSDLQLNEILLIMAWIRHMYTGPVADADWLTDEQKKTFKDYDVNNPVTLVAAGECAIPAP